MKNGEKNLRKSRKYGCYIPLELKLMLKLKLSPVL